MSKRYGVKGCPSPNPDLKEAAIARYLAAEKMKKEKDRLARDEAAAAEAAVRRAERGNDDGGDEGGFDDPGEDLRRSPRIAQQVRRTSDGRLSQDFTVILHINPVIL